MSVVTHFLIDNLSVVFEVAPQKYYKKERRSCSKSINTDTGESGGRTNV
jgi:hypothetical protein